MTTEVSTNLPAEPNNLPQQVEFTSLRQRLANLLEENRNSCVMVNGRLEITRPVALALINQLARDIASMGGNMRVKKDVLNFNPVVVKSTCIIELPNGSVLEFQALGSAEEGDINRDRRIYHDTLGTAETRSLKRLLEETIGEDFINRVLAPLTENAGQSRRASERQINFIKSLARQTGIRISEVSREAIGREINSPEELAQITSQEATAIIQKYQELQQGQ